MNRPASNPLLAICATATLALTSLSLANPNGIYTEYIDALPPGTPVIAAVFTAAQDGVFPFALPSAAVPSADAAFSPQYQPLTETVTNEEMYSSVGSSVPFEDGEELPGTAEAPDPAEAAPEPRPEAFFAVEPDWFDDAVFIGDSHTEGFCDYAGVSNATYYYKRGLSVWTVLEQPVGEGKQTVPQVLSQRRFGKIYLLLGINEIGSGTTEGFVGQYATVVAQLRKLQPDALIYIQAIFHTSQKKSDESFYNNERINERNAAIAQLADGVHVIFLDCNEVFDDENGALTKEYTGDGVHVKAPYYALWRDYLLLHGHALPEPGASIDPAEPAVALAAQLAAEEAERTAEAEKAPRSSRKGAPAQPAPSLVEPPESAEEALPEQSAADAAQQPESVEQSVPEPESDPAVSAEEPAGTAHSEAALAYSAGTPSRIPMSKDADQPVSLS